MSWNRQDEAAWAATVDVLLRSGAPWPRPLCLHDLRVFQGEVLTGRRKDLPSERELAKRWGVGKSTAHRLIASEEWHDPYRAKAWADWRAQRCGVDHLRSGGGADSGRRGGDDGAPDAAVSMDIEPQRGDLGAPSGHPRGVSGANLNTGARSHRHRTDHPAPSPDTPPTPTPLLAADDPPAPPSGCVPAPEPDGNVVRLDEARPAPQLDRVLQALQAPDEVVPTDHATVLVLHRALGRPPLDELAGQVGLVAVWARWSPEPAAARLIRGEGWAEKGDTSRSLRTICSPKDWGDRLRWAKAWRRTLLDARGALRPDVAGFITAEGDARGTPLAVFAELLGAQLDVGPPAQEAAW